MAQVREQFAWCAVAYLAAARSAGAMAGAPLAFDREPPDDLDWGSISVEQSQDDLGARLDQFRRSCSIRCCGLVGYSTGVRLICLADILFGVAYMIISIEFQYHEVYAVFQSVLRIVFGCVGFVGSITRTTRFVFAFYLVFCLNMLLLCGTFVHVSQFQGCMNLGAFMELFGRGPEFDCTMMCESFIQKECLTVVARRECRMTRLCADGYIAGTYKPAPDERQVFVGKLEFRCNNGQWECCSGSLNSCDPDWCLDHSVTCRQAMVNGSRATVYKSCEQEWDHVCSVPTDEEQTSWISGMAWHRMMADELEQDAASYRFGVCVFLAVWGACQVYWSAIVLQFLNRRCKDIVDPSHVEDEWEAEDEVELQAVRERSSINFDAIEFKVRSMK
mmetsp:Transcript_2077/g.4968  ORF Transcript_2077/g.4968 Transcript_2077/m.4968 type:complete len:389 (+) Transcript_2077:2-1168(+)